MAKLTLEDWSATAASNTDLGASLNVGGTGLVSTADDSFREIMAQTARFVQDLGGISTVGGTANALTVTLAQPFTAYGSSAGQIPNGAIIAIKAASANTAAATININSIGTSAVRLDGDAALVGGEMLANGIYLLRYDTAYNSAAGGWALLNRSALANTNGANTFTGTQTFSGLIAANGTGVQFPATQSSSSGANVLDDYEEGAWTPTLLIGGSSVGITYTTQLGGYTKIGNTVLVNANIVLSSKAALTGLVTIGGLPFTLAGNADTLSVNGWNNMASIVGNPVLQALAGGTIANLNMSGAAASAGITNANLTNTSQLLFSGSFIVAT